MVVYYIKRISVHRSKLYGMSLCQLFLYVPMYLPLNLYRAILLVCVCGTLLFGCTARVASRHESSIVSINMCANPDEPARPRANAVLNFEFALRYRNQQTRCFTIRIRVPQEFANVRSSCSDIMSNILRSCMPSSTQFFLSHSLSITISLSLPCTFTCASIVQNNRFKF